jgi:mRNA interferase MazF
MEKDFNSWNIKKQRIDAKEVRPYFQTGQIWWVHLGQNIGYEMNGKGSRYLRPVIIIKKFNPSSFLAIPIGTSPIRNQYRVSVGIILGKLATANLSQVRYLDSKRLVKKILALDWILFEAVKKKASEANFN